MSPDTEKLSYLLESTLNPELKQQAENELEQVNNSVGFIPCLFQLILTDKIDPMIRQAGVIYFKNMINNNWYENKPEYFGQIVPFNIPEQDKQLIRQNLIEGIINSTEPIRTQLIICVRTILAQDLPDKWNNIADKVHYFIQTNHVDSWYGALQGFYQMCKIYEYKTGTERELYYSYFKVLVPIFLNRLIELNQYENELSVLAQKLILKIFFIFIRFELPMEVINEISFIKWIEMLNKIYFRPLPVDVEQMNDDERQKMLCWKIKKWACRILNTIYDRYDAGNCNSLEGFLKGNNIENQSTPNASNVHNQTVKKSQKKCDEIKLELERLEKEVDLFKGKKSDRCYLILDESLTRCLLRLDEVEKGDDEFNQYRKGLIKNANSLSDRLESKCNFNEYLGVSDFDRSNKTVKTSQEIKCDEIKLELERLENKINLFKGKKPDRDYLLLDELLTRCLLRLDEIEKGDDSFNIFRKSLITYVQKLSDRLESKCAVSIY